jgi:hypothetical protein
MVKAVEGMVPVNDFTFLDCLERLSKEISEGSAKGAPAN